MQRRREAVLTVRNGERGWSSNFGDRPPPATISSEHVQTAPSSCPRPHRFLFSLFLFAAFHFPLLLPPNADVAGGRVICLERAGRKLL